MTTVRFKYYKLGLNLLGGCQAKPICDAIELVKRVELDDNLASLTVLSHLNAYLCVKVTAQRSLQVQDMRGF